MRTGTERRSLARKVPAVVTLLVLGVLMARPSVIITLRAVVICIPRRSGRRHLGQFVAQPAVKPAGRDVYGCAHARNQRGRATTHSNDTAHCEVVDKTSAEQVASLGGWRCLDLGEIGKRSAKGLGAREKAT